MKFEILAIVALKKRADPRTEIFRLHVMPRDIGMSEIKSLAKQWLKQTGQTLFEVFERH